MADINNYRSRIKIYKKVLTSNSMGGYTSTYQLIDTIWGKIIPISGKEIMQYTQIYPTASYQIYIRYRPDLNADYQFYYNKRYFNILSIIDIDNKQDEMLCICDDTKGEQEV